MYFTKAKIEFEVTTFKGAEEGQAQLLQMWATTDVTKDKLKNLNDELELLNQNTCKPQVAPIFV